MQKRGFVLGDRVLGQAADTHADWCALYGQHGAYHFVGASAIGKLHLRDGRPRDDALAVRASDAWLAVAVADGAGSHSMSRYGASYAVEAVCEYLLREVAGNAADETAKSMIPRDPHNIAEEQAGEQVPAIAADSSSAVAGNAPDGSSRKTIPLDENTNDDKPRTTAAQHSNFNILETIKPSALAASNYGTLTWYLPQSTDTTVPDQPTGNAVLRSASEYHNSMRRAFQRTREGMEQLAQSQKLRMRELACTLLAVLLNIETGDLVVGQIGDGLILALQPKQGAFPMVDAPVPTALGASYMLSDREWEQYFRTEYKSGNEGGKITTLYLMTDGVAEDCTHPPPPDVLQRWAMDIDREMRQAESLSHNAARLLRWLATYDAPSSFDDRTLIVLMR